MYNYDWCLSCIIFIVRVKSQRAIAAAAVGVGGGICGGYFVQSESERSRLNTLQILIFNV